MTEHRDTIFALSTPPGRGGIAVFRISGPADGPTEPGLRSAGGSSVEVINGPASVIPKVWITGTPKSSSTSAISEGARAAATDRIMRSEFGRVAT